MEKKYDLIGVDETLVLSKSKIKEHYRNFGNSYFVIYLGLLGYARKFNKAEGCFIWDENGNHYLDCFSGYGVLALGHNHPKVIAEIQKVLEKKSPNVLQASLSPHVAVLCHNLAEITPEGLLHSFLCNSGTEATEGALKTARIATGRREIIYCDNSFHGKTLGALSVTGREKYQKPFQPLLPEVKIIPFGEIEPLEKELKRRKAAAFIVEPIQGEGGIIVPPEGYLGEAENLCRKYGTLLILDEIQTGFGRTGAMFAADLDGVKPDIMCLAKALSGGIIPIGAFITTSSVWNKAYGGIEKCLLHTSTFGGNTLACVAANSTIKVIVEENLPKQAKEKGEYLLAELQKIQRKYSLIREVRGRGLLIGIEFENNLPLIGKKYFASVVASELLDKHKIITAYTLNNPNVIRIAPPLIIEKEQIDKIITALDKVCSQSSTQIWSKGGKKIIQGIFNRQ